MAAAHSIEKWFSQPYIKVVSVTDNGGAAPVPKLAHPDAIAAIAATRMTNLTVATTFLQAARKPLP